MRNFHGHPIKKCKHIHCWYMSNIKAVLKSAPHEIFVRSIGKTVNDVIKS